MIGVYLKSFVVLLATSLLAYAAIPGLELWKMVAAALGISLLLPITYPHYRGIRKGDGILLIKGNVEPLLLFNASSCVALADGKVGRTIGIMLPDGTIAEGTVVGYEGLITPAKVRVVQEHRPRTVDGVTVI